MQEALQGVCLVGKEHLSVVSPGGLARWRTTSGQAQLMVRCQAPK